MENWSPGYEVLRTYVRFAFWLSHKKVIVNGLENIPKEIPIIFAPNHQNALMDPLALVCTNPNQTVWLARADIFKAKIARSALKFIKMLPIYRIRDGKDNLSNNELIFSQVIQILEAKRSIGLFPEAAHSFKRQMLPHQKAVPRIALEAEEKNNFRLELQIVPVGIFYDHYWQFNRTLIVNYGQPIRVDKYQDEFIENPQKAMLSLRDEIYERLCELTIHIDSKKYYQEYELIRELVGQEHSKSKNLNLNKRLNHFYAEKNLLSKLEKLETDQPEIAQKLLDETGNYFKEMKTAGVTDKQIRIAENSTLFSFFVRIVSALISFPVFLFGFFLNALPFYYPRIFIHGKVKDKAFLSTFNFAAGLIIYPIAYFLEAGLIFILSKSILIALIVFFLMPFSGKIAYKLLLFYKDLFVETASRFGDKKFRGNLNKFSIKRNELLKSLEF